MAKQKTPLIDELEKGPWPSHVTELKKTRYPIMMYEEAYKNKFTQWGHGGFVSVPGIGAGILARDSKRPELVKRADLIRVLGPCGGFYKTDTFRKICKIIDEMGDGSLHLHSTNSNIEVPEIPSDKMVQIVEAFNKLGFDVGSSGDAIRNIPECVGPARCEWALTDTLRLRRFLMMHYLDDVQYPRFPYKIKTKISGCPNECAKAILHADIGIIGVFKDAPKVDQKKLKEDLKRGYDLEYVIKRCPGGEGTMIWDGERLEFDNDKCVHCMYCINEIPSIEPGEERGVAVTVGGKMKGKYGPMTGRVLVPFMKIKPPEYKELIKLLDNIIEVYDANGRSKERMGDLIYRKGIDWFMEQVGVEPASQNIVMPRANIYYHWKEEELRK